MSSLRATGKPGTQQERHYRSDRLIQRDGRQFPTAFHMADYVKRLTQQKWFRAKFGRQYLRVETTSGNRSSNASGGGLRPGGFHTITINRRDWNEATVLHEIAHCVRRIDGQWPREQGAFHGPEFAATMLLLVQHQMGSAVAAKLKVAHRVNHVRYKKPRAPLPPERKAALIAQLRHARLQPKLASGAARGWTSTDEHLVSFGGDY